MKLVSTATLVSALVLSSVAMNAYAASPNPPKPRCPAGQVAVLDGGHWECKPLVLKAPGSGQTNSGAAGGALKQYDAPKPDLVILSATRIKGDDNTFKVKVRNQGAANTSGGQLQGLNYGKSGGGATAYLPKFNAGQIQIVDVKFNTSKFERGDRVMFIVDSTNAIAESNENNNKLAVNY